jgi:hypothetical protein
MLPLTASSSGPQACQVLSAQASSCCRGRQRRRCPCCVAAPGCCLARPPGCCAAQHAGWSCHRHPWTLACESQERRTRCCPRHCRAAAAAQTPLLLLGTQLFQAAQHSTAPASRAVAPLQASSRAAALQPCCPLQCDGAPTTACTCVCGWQGGVRRGHTVIDRQRAHRNRQHAGTLTPSAPAPLPLPLAILLGVHERGAGGSTTRREAGCCAVALPGRGRTTTGAAAATVRTAGGCGVKTGAAERPHTTGLAHALACALCACC